ncbi:MAG: hypothetical protein SFX73_04565 [Kofleriaceae bacterium]|nr:hypothetical protein [Kofleriaceae bacterium]
MTATRLLSAFLIVGSITGCATQASDGPEGGGGGKADDGNEAGLHVRAIVTELNEFSSIRWPEAVDEASDVDDVINAQLDFETITGEKLEDVKTRFDNGDMSGLASADFHVDGNVRNVLSLTIDLEWLAAYSSFYSEYKNFNSMTGEMVEITDLLTADKLPELAAELDAKLQARIAQIKADNREAIASGELDESMWAYLHVMPEHLASFSTSPEGITFHWRAGFPHAYQALEPNGEFVVSMVDLENYISADGLWAEEY